MTESICAQSMNMPKNSICFGVHAVAAKLEHHRSVSKLYVTASPSSPRLDALEQIAVEQHIEVVRCAKNRLDELSNYGAHQGIAAEYRSESTRRTSTLKQVLRNISSENALILVLDHLQDPHNLGACLRTAECAGVAAVILPRHSACPVNQTVVKVASGAVEFLSTVLVSNVVSTLELLKKNGFWIYGMCDAATTELYETNFQGRVAVVVGHEGKGIKRLVKQSCDMLVRIPVLGQVPSLNVSVATGICLYEIRRQLDRV